ncbi:MAG: hypothetical protein HWN81_00025 [Candidatus Lokiarchaeota archaeon]|nr:hypothetical protein [Candidatus Lokiarchaeota archaeon]
MATKQDLIYEIVKESQEELKKIHEEQVRQGIHIAQNTKDLEHHIKRSDQFEEDLKLHRNNDLRHKNPLTVKGLFVKSIWFFGGIGTIIGAMYALLKLLETIKQ